jgi:hypothetical protein
MDSIDPSAPRAAAGRAAAVEVVGAGLAGALCTAVDPVDAVHPPTNIAVNAAIAVVVIFMVILVCPFLMGRLQGCGGRLERFLEAISAHIFGQHLVSMKSRVCTTGWTVLVHVPS